MFADVPPKDNIIHPEFAYINVAVSPTALKVMVLYPSFAEAAGVTTPTGVLPATVQTNILICPCAPAASEYA